jgi:phosphate/sulfate permease
MRTLLGCRDVASNIVIAWLITLPPAALIAALFYVVSVIVW